MQVFSGCETRSHEWQAEKVIDRQKRPEKGRIQWRKSDIRYQAYVSILEEEAEAGDGMYGADRHRLLRGSREEVLGGLPGEGEGRSQRQHDQERKVVIVPNTDHLKGNPGGGGGRNRCR